MISDEQWPGEGRPIEGVPRTEGNNDAEQRDIKGEI